MPILNTTTPLGGDDAAAGPGMGFEAMIVWLYYPDIPEMLDWYQTTFGFPESLDQGWVKGLRTSYAGFIGLVDSTRGMHSFTEDKAVTVSFFVEDVTPWHEHLEGAEGYRPRTGITSESDRVTVFVGYDPGNYFLEFDTFVDAPGNEELRARRGPDRGAARRSAGRGPDRGIGSRCRPEAGAPRRGGQRA